ncbi:hypothetical protein EVAR_40922_1 [Eumeta japonica]|uniref:Uncharacterized protein n=1 Tax=Eumeta variegata TaxID=151549 RepID=A0A4C1X7N6_EUMVA|nr:hypothetical protein EVAR_40922_1 [Eumeta japonica]
MKIGTECDTGVKNNIATKCKPGPEVETRRGSEPEQNRNWNAVQKSALDTHVGLVRSYDTAHTHLGEIYAPRRERGGRGEDSKPTGEGR